MKRRSRHKNYADVQDDLNLHMSSVLQDTFLLDTLII